MRTLTAAALLLLFLWMPVQAQTNLLTDGGFEAKGDFKQVATDIAGDGTQFGVPQAWDGWVVIGSGSPAWQNRVPTGFPHTGLFKTPADSAQSLHIARGYATFTAAVFQRVTVPEDSNVQASAWGYMERRAGSDPSVAGAQFRIGIDTAGGRDPNAATVVWSNWVTQADAWVQANASATAQGTTVTLFLYATQSAPSEPNGIYWDSASLTVGGSGGSAGTLAPGVTPSPVIPTPALASFVQPQPPQPDGSIVHLVMSGDTLDAIAVAYGVTRQEILDLNGMSSGRFLQIGQRLLIREATGGTGDDAPDETEDPEPETIGTAGTEAVNPAQPRTTAATATPTPQPQDDPTADTGTADAQVNPTEDTAPTDEPTATPVPATATEAPPAPVTQVAQVDTTVSGVCVSMFEDADQNRIQAGDEQYLANGTITIANGPQALQEYITDGQSEPFCFEDVAPGDYTAVATAPDGYGLTTAAQLRLRVQAGARVNATFGAAQGVEAVAPPPADSSPAAIQEEAAPSAPVNPLLQNIGLIVFAVAGVVLVGGLGIALMMRRR